MSRTLLGYLLWKRRRQIAAAETAEQRRIDPGIAREETETEAAEGEDQNAENRNHRSRNARPIAERRNRTTREEKAKLKRRGLAQLQLPWSQSKRNKSLKPTRARNQRQQQRIKPVQARAHCPAGGQQLRLLGPALLRGPLPVRSGESVRALLVGGRGKSQGVTGLSLTRGVVTPGYLG